MKKITMFFAALLIVCNASAWPGGPSGNVCETSATGELGTFDPTTRMFTKNVNSTQMIKFNPECLSFAVAIFDNELLTFLGENADYTMFLSAVRTDDGGGANQKIYPNAGGSWEAPYIFVEMIRVDNWTYSNGDLGDGVLFYICGYNLLEVEGAPDAVIEFGTHLHTNMLIAPMDNEAWGPTTAADAEAEGVSGYCYLGSKNEALGTPVTDCVTCTPLSGIADTIADEMGNVEIVGYYTLLGQKLAEEPANGIFIVKFSNGKTVKIAK
jgi:hypothetical protein